MPGPAVTPAPTPRERTAIARLEHERAARRRFVDACALCARREGLVSVAVDPAGLDEPDETWIHGAVGASRSTFIGATLLVAGVGIPVLWLMGASWGDAFIAAGYLLVLAALALSWRARRSVVAVIHASRRSLSAARMAALCREIQHEGEADGLWVFSRGGFDPGALAFAHAQGVRCFERNGQGFEQLTPDQASWARSAGGRARSPEDDEHHSDAA